MRMLQPGENVLLAQETSALINVVNVDAQQLEGDGLRPARQFAFGLEHAGHAAGAHEAKYAIARDRRRLVGRMVGDLRQPLRHAALENLDRRRIVERLRHQRTQRRVFAMTAQPRWPLSRGHLEQLIDQRFDLQPSLGKVGDHWQCSSRLDIPL